MNRWFSLGTLTLVVLLGGGCGSTVLELPSLGEGGASSGGVGSATTHGGGGDATAVVTTAQSGGGGAASDVDDTGTLAVQVEMRTYALAGAKAEAAQVSLMVSVFEWETNAPVTDAIVTVGPLGSPMTLDYDVYSTSIYEGVTTGYVRAWELSIVRGADHLTGAVIVGPSFHTVVVSEASNGATIAWSPSDEAGVRTYACASGTDPLNPREQCADANDEGSIQLAPVEHGAEVLVDRRTKVPLGIGGSATVDVTIESKVP